MVREPILILDKDLRVMVANESFYRAFQVEAKDTEGTVVYELGTANGTSPPCENFLRTFCPRTPFSKDLKCPTSSPSSAARPMILNARQIHKENTASVLFPPIILLAMEDITDMMAVAETLAEHAKQFEAKLTERTEKREIISKNSNGRLTHSKRKYSDLVLS